VEIGIGSHVEKIFMDGSSTPNWQVIETLHGFYAEQVILGLRINRLSGSCAGI
jgi:hypothetical protein